MIRSAMPLMVSGDDSSGCGLTCLVVEDDVMVGQMLTVVLQTFPGVGEVISAMTVAEAIKNLQAEDVDLVILDFKLPDGSGLEVLEAAARLRPQADCIVVSAAANEFTCPAPLANQCKAIIDKTESLERLRKEVGASVQRLIGGRGGNLLPDPASVLRARELQIFERIGRGMSTKQIAESLGITVHTVNSHRKSIVSKLGVVGADLVRIATLYVIMPRSRDTDDGRST